MQLVRGVAPVVRVLTSSSARRLHRSCPVGVGAGTDRTSPTLLFRKSSMTAAASTQRVDAVLDYWFGEDWNKQPAGYWPADRGWFLGGPQKDQDIKQRFTADVEAVAAGEYDEWQHQPLTCLAGLILMDQFTRNIYRGTGQAFSLDAKALTWASQLTDSGKYKELRPFQRQFVLLPLMHSEDLAVQQRCVALFKDEVAEAQQQQPAEAWKATVGAMQGCLQFAEAHERVIAKWGRFPRRNEPLGRQSTPEEEQAMQDGSIPKW